VCAEWYFQLLESRSVSDGAVLKNPKETIVARRCVD
jgi:hypothetical protein